MTDTHSRRSRPRGRVLLHAVAGTIIWVLAASYLSRGFLELIPYTAPAAITGLTIGWVSHAFAQRQFRWSTGAKTALAGALYLTPLIGAMIALSGAFGAEIVLFVFTIGAWALIVFALVVGALLYVGRVVASPRRRRRTAARARHAYRRIRRPRQRRAAPTQSVEPAEPIAMDQRAQPAESTTERDVGEWRNRID